MQVTNHSNNKRNMKEEMLEGKIKRGYLHLYRPYQERSKQR